jgi:predicted RNase H-like nuclease
VPSPDSTSACEVGPVAGVDGAAGRWVVAVLDGTHLSTTLVDTVSDVLVLTADCAAVGVDMPLAIPDAGVRASETAVRTFLGPARSSLFPTPVRDAVYAPSWEEACVIARARTGKAISKQSWFLTAHIRAWEDAAPDPSRVVEVHPESSFRALAPTVTFTSKKRARGVAQRIAALSAVVDTVELLDSVRSLADGPAMDDVLDAVAAAWSARRWLTGEATVFGDGSVDAGGRPDRIVV